MRAGNNEAQAVGAALGSKGLFKSDSRNCGPALILRQGPRYPADLERMRTLFAASGFALHPLQGDSLVVSRWGMYRVLPDLPAAEKMLRDIGGARG